MESDSGIHVRLRDQPGIRGVTTGNVRKIGTFDYQEVELGPNNRKWYRSSQLEPDGGVEDAETLFFAGQPGM